MDRGLLRADRIHRSVADGRPKIELLDVGIFFPAGVSEHVRRV